MKLLGKRVVAAAGLLWVVVVCCCESLAQQQDHTTAAAQRLVDELLRRDATSKERPRPRDRIVEDLLAIGPDAVPVLLDAIKRQRSLTGGNVTYCLNRFGKTAIAHLLQTMKDADPERRALAAVVLGTMRPVDRSVIKALAKALGDRNVQVRDGAAAGLCLLGPEARFAESDLLRAAKDRSPGVRTWAFRALIACRGIPRSSIGLVVAALFDALRRERPGMAREISAVEAAFRR